MSTLFDREKFTWDGMYLMYRGNYEGCLTMDEVNPKCHSSWIGKPRPLFIARFKYGYKPWKTWVNFLIKQSITVEHYAKSLDDGETPRGFMESHGYKGK